jgi:hypothetical protein
MEGSVVSTLVIPDMCQAKLEALDQVASDDQTVIADLRMDASSTRTNTYVG